MKSSTYLLIIGLAATIAQAIRPSDTMFIAVFIIISAMYICRAIEQSGSNRGD